KRSPQFSGKEIEFVSLSIGSFKQPQQLMAFNYALAMGAEFDVVVNLDGLNEVAWYGNDNWPHRVSHLYPIGWHWFVPPGRLAIMGARSAQVAYAEESRRRWAALFESAPLRYSVAANLVWLLRDRRLVAFSEAYPSRPAIEKGYVLMREAGRRLAARGVRFHDVSMAYARSEETFYYDNCCHINRAGSEALAVPMARAILETPEPPLA